MKPFTKFTGLVMPLDRSNVDTDAIIPKQYLKSIHRTGFGVSLFDDWRYLDNGNPGDDHSKRKPNMDFILNQPRYRDAEILLARKNFGCGSSREHAVWALMDYGFRAVIAPGYADIFLSNSYKNGFLPVILPDDAVDELFMNTFANEGYKLTINLEEQTVIMPDGKHIKFEIDAGLKNRLINGIDEIGITLSNAERIREYEKKQQAITPWLFPKNR